MSADCGICYDEYDSNEQVPCIGTCGHTICDRCRLSMQNSKCPHCNRKEAFAVKHVNKQLWDLIQISNFVLGKSKSEQYEKGAELKKCNNCDQKTKKLWVCVDCCMSSGIVKKFLSGDENPEEEEEEKAIERIRGLAWCGDCTIDEGHCSHRTENVDTFVESYLNFLKGNTE